MNETLLTAFVTFFVVIDPVAIAPLFLTLVHDSSEALRRQMALKATAIAAGVLLVFAVSGDVFLRSLGITLSALRIAGGALLFLLSIDMVLARPSGLRTTTAGEEAEATHKADIAVFPLAIPLIAGPGAITSTVLLIGRHAGDPVQQAAVMVVLFFVLVLNLGVLLAATRLMRVLGVTGVNVVTRVFGIILAALAVQFMLDGLTASFPGRVPRVKGVEQHHADVLQGVRPLSPQGAETRAKATRQGQSHEFHHGTALHVHAVDESPARELSHVLTPCGLVIPYCVGAVQSPAPAPQFSPANQAQRRYRPN